MHTKSSHKSRKISLKQKLYFLGVEKLSQSCGFEQRRGKKLGVKSIIEGFIHSSFGNNFSLSTWAAQVGWIIKDTVSKQAIAYRVNDRFIGLLKELLSRSLGKTMNGKGRKLLGRFSNVYLQDSSCLSLPDVLKEEFKGNFSRGKIKSVAKIQVIFNLMKGCMNHLELSPYCRNDQAASRDILSVIQKGDLVIRDMGYFVLEVLQAITDRQAHFISHLRKDVCLYDHKSGRQIQLTQLLKNKSFVRKKVSVGRDQKVQVTLLAIKTSAQVRDYRKMKLLRDRDKRKKNPAERLYLAGWDIFITSLEDISGQEIKDVYRLRWQIEIIFKSWKSHLRIEQNISVHLKKTQLPKVIIYLTLLMVTLLIMPVYYTILYKNANQRISLLKLTKTLLTILPAIDWSDNNSFIDKLSYYSRFEIRKRTNLTQKIHRLF